MKLACLALLPPLLPTVEVLPSLVPLAYPPYAGVANLQSNLASADLTCLDLT